VSIAVDANNAFAIALYSEVSPAANGGNFLTSPLSATLALTMTYAGARGTTATQMATALHIPSSGPSIFDAQNALSQALDGRAAAALAADKQRSEGSGSAPSSSDYQMQVVNSVWGQKGYPWATGFLATLAASYGTGVYVEDFTTNSAGAESAINNWVSDETSGKINPLLSPGDITPDTRMVLVNAIHVKLPWENPFDATQTAPATFTRGDGSTVQPSFMNQTFTSDGSQGAIGYAQTADGQFLSLPLAGSQVSVVFALPAKDLPTLTGSLTKDSFTVPATGSIVVLKLPKFTFTSQTFSLAKSLQALGMTQAFDPVNADFKGMCAATPDGDNLYISDVLQKAMLDVAENGVEAAAATAVVMAGAGIAGPTPPTITLTFDHPFIVSIVDSSGAILFLGQIDDPTASGS